MSITIVGLEDEQELSRFLEALSRWYEMSADERLPEELLAKAVSTRYMECIDAGWAEESLQRLAKSFGWYE